MLCYLRECKCACEHVCIFSYAHMCRTVSSCQGNVLIKHPNRNRVMDRLEWEGREKEREREWGKVNNFETLMHVLYSPSLSFPGPL